MLVAWSLDVNGTADLEIYPVVQTFHVGWEGSTVRGCTGGGEARGGPHLLSVVQHAIPASQQVLFAARQQDPSKDWVLPPHPRVQSNPSIPVGHPIEHSSGLTPFPAQWDMMFSAYRQWSTVRIRRVVFFLFFEGGGTTSTSCSFTQSFLSWLLKCDPWSPSIW